MLPNGHAYALIAVTGPRLDRHFDEALELGGGLWVSPHLPIAIPAHWREWIGTLQAEALENATFFIVAAERSSPDTHGEHLPERAHRLYFASLVHTPFVHHLTPPITLRGTVGADVHTVRSKSEYPPVFRPGGTQAARLRPGDFEVAASMVPALERLRGRGELDRIWRVTGAFYAGLQADAMGVRVHQFVRSIEGFILPDIAKTERQFVSRTELFVGPSHHDAIRRLYRTRSAIEHLHGPLLELKGTLRERSIQLVLCAIEAEAIARHCLTRLLRTPALWPYFSSDDALRQFWELTPDERRELWGEPMSLDEVRLRFDPGSVTDRQLGIEGRV